MKLKFTLLSIILLINLVSRATDYYWVGGTGMWSDYTDCNDNNAAKHLGALEICGNGIDHNCDGMMDADSCTSTVSAGADQTTCGDSSITLAANATTGGNWTGGAGTFNPNRNTANATYTPAVSEIGTTITLTWNVPDPDGTGPCTAAADSMTITVNTAVVANAGADQTSCGTTLFILAANTVSGGNWIGGTGTFNPNRNTANATYIPAPGEVGTTITLTWIVLDPDGAGPCTFATDQMNITINNGTVANAGADRTTCGASSITLAANATAGGNWTGGSGTFAPNRSTANATYTPAAGEIGTTITLSWNVPDQDGAGPCTASTDQINITINNATAANAGADQTICGDSSITLAANATTGGNWTGGAGTFAPNRNAASAIYTRAAAEIGTTITLTWNVPDPDGTGPCTAATDQMNITINNGTVANAGADQTTCGASSITLAANATTGSNWTGGAGTFNPNRNTANATYTPAISEIGTTITLTWNVPDPDGTGPCTAATDQMNITIKNATVANAGADQTTCGASSIILAANARGNWTGGAGTFAPNRDTANATYTPAAGEIGTTITLTWNVLDPDGAGPCTAATDSMNIVITTPITPTFTQLGPLCQNSTAPALPGTSNNGINGTWSPATINTSTAGTTTYTFTPAAGQCAAPVTMNILITTQITPTFTQIGPLCRNSTAPALPGTSNNGINGTWSPVTINTSTAGTTTYTFTPAAGQCAVPVTMNIVITITSQITPTFTQLGPFCQNSTAPALPGTSNNGINGTWSPATINTSTAGTTTYTFTPAAGQCAVPVTMNIVITITTQITPTFTQLGPLCQNSTAPALPGTSNNGINGTWSPATINTSTAGTTTYTFTPAAGQCATPVTMNIVITTQITPTFTQIGPLCRNSTAPALPGTSNNGINGTWSPVTINTSTAGTTTYTFTPAAGQCAVPVTMNIVITITSQITPTFTQLGPFCQNSTAPALPGTSNNGINGTWSPVTINTSTAGTTTYTFTPAAGQCAAPVTMNILITTQITPTFTQLGPLCQNSTAPALPGTSNNGINGTWSPATINTSTAGTTTYTFTPAAGQCAAPVTMNIVIESCCIGSVSVGPDATSYFGLISEQCVTKTAVVQNGTGPYTYSWTLDRSLLAEESITNANSASVTVCLLDTANLCVTVTDANGCVFTDCANIFAQDVRCYAGNSNEHKIYVCHNNNTICVDQSTLASHLDHGDYYGQCISNTLNVGEITGQEISGSMLKIYPNPSHGNFTFYINSSVNYVDAEIINMSGQIIKQVKINGQSKIDFRINNAGVYFIRVISTDRKILTRKVVVLE